MKQWLGSSIHRYTLFVSLLPAVLVAFVLTGYFTLARLQSLQEELASTGQLFANQLAPAAEFSVISGNLQVLDSLLQGTLKNPNIAFIEIYDNQQQLLTRVAKDLPQHSVGATFKANITRQNVQLDPLFLSSSFLSEAAQPEESIGHVVLGMTDSALKKTTATYFISCFLVDLYGPIADLGAGVQLGAQPFDTYPSDAPKIT